MPLQSASITFNGGTLQWASGNTQDISAGLAAIPAGQTANFDTNGNNVTFNTGVAGSGGLNKLGGGVLILAGNNTYSGATTITAGTLQVGNGGTGEGFASPSVGGAGTMAFNIGDSLTYGGTLNNSGGLLKSGTGSLTWNSMGNALTGTIEVSAGTLNVGNGVWGNGIFNSGTGRTWQVDSGAVLTLGSGRQPIPTTTSSTAAC